MTGIFLLDWAIMVVSLFDIILLFWLGLTVLLNAERRTWGVWMAGGGMLMGGVFFISHAALLGHGLYYVSEGMNFWWHVGWVPVVASPFAWYTIMLWYAGFWDEADNKHPADKEHPRQSHLHRRQRPWFLLTVLFAASLVGMLIFANPLPSYLQVAQLRLSATPSVGGIPLLILVYPFYIVLCISLSLDVLRRPGPSSRVMGDLARRRARPWLVAASVALLLASLLVAWIMLWIILNANQRARSGVYTEMALTVAWFDLAISLLITVAMILLGQAIVSYEVFTGKTLPRRGLFQHWRRAVILAAGYGAVVGWGLALRLRSIYSLLLTTLLMVTFYALLNWRSYAERERTIEHLRPFVASERLYERLLTSSAPPQSPPILGKIGREVDVETPFRALCDDVLETRVAYLVALGSLAPLVGPPLVYPENNPATLPSLAEITRTTTVRAQFDSPQTMYVSLDPARYGGATWAVPLWSERGLIGVLLLGEKRDGGLYTQEEIEIARASGERLIDTQASGELARRLMALQRQRLTESQVLDQQTRRVLHDDVLPILHAAMLTLSSGGESPETVSLLADVHRQIADLLHELPAGAASAVARLGIVSALRQTVNDELGDGFDDVTWEIEPEAEREAQRIPTLTAEVLFYAAREAIRNAARHGRDRETSHSLNLHIKAVWHNGLEIAIEDDGVGLDAARKPDESSGQGLTLHSTMMAVVGGTLAIESMSGAYTRVTLTLPEEIW
jgi:signal transduction histidine kinase